MSDSKQKGEQTDAIVLGELKKRGLTVAVPFGENQRYDFIIEFNGDFYRLQCKTGRYREGTVRFPTRSIQPGSQGHIKSDYSGEIDFFVVHVRELEQTFLVPEEAAATNSMRLRVDPPKNNQTKGVNWAKEFRLDSTIEGLSEPD
jgi:hypothetical protein